MAAPTTLPPLNPMHRAPRDGTRIVVMDHSGTIAIMRYGENVGWRADPTWDDAGLRYLYDNALLGWWPMPEVRE